ncbi:MAG: hypothetical protein ABI771_15555 [Betaproteobacteria bacterium]
MPRETYRQSFGATLQLASFVALLGLVPYSLFAGYWLYETASSWTGGSVSFIVYPIARAIACVILIYALWKLRKTGMRLRQADPPRG